jgi:indole-3-glycerol phosphate synthase
MSEDVLARIVEHKRREIEADRPRAETEDWRGHAEAAPAPSDFHAALAVGGRMRIIAEIKRASPSAGALREGLDPVTLARRYVESGADCISVLTDREFFHGSLDDLRHVHAAVRVPLLRKDFILDPIQVYEAKIAGASAVLLIAECLSPDELASLATLIHRLGMTALVELYDPANLDAVLASGARVVGVNNRDLRTFKTDLEQTLRLRPAIPRDRVLVSESGIKERTDVERLEAAGVQAILVGESLLRAADPGAKIAELVGK